MDKAGWTNPSTAESAVSSAILLKTFPTVFVSAPKALIFPPTYHCVASQAPEAAPYASPPNVEAPSAQASSVPLEKPITPAVVASCPAEIAAPPAPKVKAVTATTPTVYPTPLPIPLTVSNP